MRLLSSGSYNIAWFKLADFVVRGEKERALSVYKLLMHSVQDSAFSYKLEGDILLAFDDDEALERYHCAANIYKKNKQLQEAISIYEHVTLFKEDVKILEALLDVYTLIDNEDGIIDTFARFAIAAVKQKDFGLLVNRLQLYLMTKNSIVIAELYGKTVFSLLLYDKHNPQIETYLFQTLNFYIKFDKSNLLDKFLSKLKVSNQKYYEVAENFLLMNN